MRIIVAHNTYQQAGGEDTSFNSEVDLLRQHGHEVFTYLRHNSELEQIPALNAAIETVWSRESVKAIGDLIDSTQAELVHFHNTLTRISPAAYYAAKAKGAAVVQTLHNYRLLCPVATFSRIGKQPCEDCLGKTPPWPSIFHACWRSSRPQTAVVASMLTVHRLLGTWSNKVDRYIALTEFARQKFIEGGLPGKKISVKPNFVSENKKARSAKNFALYVGRLASEKGIQTLLAAWKQIQNLPLKIAGDVPQQALVTDSAKRSANIEWLGRLSADEVQGMMANASFLIFPSILYEGMPMTIIEAFAAGLPVIASRRGVMQEMITDGETGLLFESNTPLDLAEKVNWAHQHKREMEQMREACLSVYAQKWTPEKNYKLLIDIYQKALYESRQSHN